MTDERSERVQRLFERALELTPEERVQLLDRECGDDAEIRREVESLIRHHLEASDDHMWLAETRELGEAVADPVLDPTVPARADPRVGSTIGDYRIKRVIATGGMGVVFEAYGGHPRRTVALKVMKKGLTSESARRRFEFEIQILTRLEHPNIATIYQSGTHREGDDEIPYFALEYIPNARTITDYCDRKKLGVRDRLALFAIVCDAVHHGHQKGVIHRDLKPGNILIDPHGRPKIIDFGVARATDSDVFMTSQQTLVGQLVGTLPYMSPEQCEADPHDIDVRSDVYALGVVLYELLCGQLPYDLSRAAVHEAARVIREDPPVHPSTISRALRGDIETITLKALEKDRERRYRSAIDLGDDLRHYLKAEPITARPASFLYQLRMMARRNRAGFAVTAMVVISALALIAAIWMGLIASNRGAREMAATEAAAAETARAEAKAARVTQLEASLRDLSRRALYDVYEEVEQLPGSLPALQLIAVNATARLEELTKAAEETPAARRELADAHELLGDIQAGQRSPHLGSRNDALANYEEALRLREALLRESPDDAELSRGVAETHLKLGDLARATGDLDEGARQYDLGLQELDRIPRSSPADPERRRLRANLLMAKGDVAKRQGDLDGAEKRYDESLRLRQAGGDDGGKPGRRRDLAINYNRLGLIAEERGDSETARGHFEANLKIREDLYGDDPQNARFQRDLWTAHYMFARFLLGLDNAEEAARHLDEGEQVLKGLSDARIRRDLALTRELRGLALREAQDLDGALEAFEGFADDAEALVALDPDNLQYRRMLAFSHEHLAGVRGQRGEVDLAREQYRRAIEMLNELVAANPKDAGLQEAATRVEAALDALDRTP